MLQKFSFQFLKERAFIIAQIFLDPVLRVNKNFTVSLPEHIALHPFPAALVKNVTRHTIIFLQAEETTLNKQLHGINSLLDTRCLHAGIHLHIDEEELK